MPYPIKPEMTLLEVVDELAAHGVYVMRLQCVHGRYETTLRSRSRRVMVGVAHQGGRSLRDNTRGSGDSPSAALNDALQPWSE